MCVDVIKDVMYVGVSMSGIIEVGSKSVFRKMADFVFDYLRADVV